VRGEGEGEGTAALLRRHFDQAFAEPHRPPPAASVDLLALRLSGRRYAIRQDQVSGLVARRPVIALPSSHPHLLGLAGVRGVLVPVFSLAGLMGATASGERADWLVLCGHDEPVGLAFQDLDRYVRVPLTALHVGRDGGPGQAIALVDGEPRVLIDVPELLATVRRNRAGEPAKER
jgi:chemotaxis signal transduction protein